MTALARLKRAVGLRLDLQAVTKHRSRLGRHVAPRYSEYLEACGAAFRGASPITPPIADKAREFEDKGFSVVTAHIFGTQKNDPRQPGFDRIDR